MTAFKRQIMFCCRFTTAVLLLWLFFAGQTPVKQWSSIGIPWQTVDAGLSIAEIAGPYVSKVADSKVTVVKIDPAFYNFEFHLSTQYDSVQRTTREWCEFAGLTAAINAGMYSLEDHISGTGYLQNFSHINNPVFKENFNAMALFNPVDSNDKPFQIIDAVGEEWKTSVQKYHCALQSIRMIDATSAAVYWHKKPAIRCSMTVLAIDKMGNVLWLFVRSPYTANEFINFMLRSGLGIKSAMYLEGGPEASIYLKAGEKEIEKFGSYVSYSHPSNDNEESRKMPNVIGLRKKLR